MKHHTKDADQDKVKETGSQTLPEGGLWIQKIIGHYRRFGGSRGVANARLSCGRPSAGGGGRRACGSKRGSARLESSCGGGGERWSCCGFGFGFRHVAPECTECCRH